MGEWVEIFHPETKGTATVHQGSLSQWYQSGWRLIADGDIPQPEPPPPPAPVSRTQAAQAAAETEPEEM